MASEAEIEASARAAYEEERKSHSAWQQWDDLPKDVPNSARHRWIRMQTAALEAAERARWQPIETAPKDGTKILVYTSRKEIPRAEVSYWHQPENPAAPGFWTAGIKATHWQPLSFPPKDK